MTNQESKPRVVGTERPKVVSTPQSERRIRVWAPKIGEPCVKEAEAYVAGYKDFAGFLPTDGFMEADMLNMVQAARIAPVRFIFETRTKTEGGRSETGHWMLFLGRTSANFLRVYDPSMGVRNLAFQDSVHRFVDVMFNALAEAKFESEKKAPGDNTIFTKMNLLNPRTESEYGINEDILLKLGPLQKNFYDCGPLCVYAAAVSRRPAVIKS